MCVLVGGCYLELFGVSKMTESERTTEEEWEEEREDEEAVGVSGRRRKSEEEVYTLLFQEVDTEGRGEVAVESLVDYLHQMQLGSAQSLREEVYDSHEDVRKLIHFRIYVLLPCCRCTWSDTTCSC